MKTYKIHLSGRVQGVGFRPFIYRLALAHQLVGRVSNAACGVVIYVNTKKPEVDLFLEDVFKKKPKASFITSQLIEEVPFIKFADFQIGRSEAASDIHIPLTPDFAICNECKADISNPENRRFNYAFTTCTQCGPRYAISKQYPFERRHTSVSSFQMCLSCASEYATPLDRRFHAQTISCQACGMQLQLTSVSKKIPEPEQRQVLKKVTELIKNGHIVAVKGTNGYLLICDAKNTRTINRLRQKKQRPHKPFALLYPAIERVENDFYISEREKNTLQSDVSPIVILQNNKTGTLSENISPNISQTGVMLPSSALLHILMSELQQPVIATSGNSHDSPIISNPQDAERHLAHIADYFLHHNLEIVFPQDDSLVKFAGNRQIVLRRSRGLAPSHINITVASSQAILAMGAQLKSTFTYMLNHHVYTSQYFGNLDNFYVFERYRTTLENYFKLFKQYPQTILTDTHEQYQSSIFGKELAQQYNIPVVKIQHHQAHFASVLGEHQLFNRKEKIIGVVWDGMALGEDGQLWGGEFFIYHSGHMARYTHFEYFDWIAGDKMSKEPRLCLLSLLSEQSRNHIRSKFTEIEWKNYAQLLNKNKSTLKTSSVGRLFDAVASLLNLVDFNTFEGEAGLLVENLAGTYTEGDYIDFLSEESYQKIPSRVLIQKMLDARMAGCSIEQIAASFIFTLVSCIADIAKKQQVKTVVCSGGIFQNSVIISMLLSVFQKIGVDLKTNRNMASNDENISFGQLTHYLHTK